MLTDHGIIDAHQHFWDPSRGDYQWLRPESALYQAFLPQDLTPLLRASGVQGSILVQAAPTVEETDYLLGLAQANPWILGVVGWTDLAAADAPERVAERAREPRFVGIRPMLQDLSNPAWILEPKVRAGIEAIQENGLVFDALVRATQLPELITLADRHPGLSIVLDHAAKPPFGSIAALAQWRVDIGFLAKRTNVACKLSGLVTELPNGTPADAMDGCIEVLTDLFGPDRLLWGSDWPVATTVTGYGDWLARCQVRVAARFPAEGNAIFSGNARRIYGLNAGQTIHSSEV